MQGAADDTVGARSDAPRPSSLDDPPAGRNPAWALGSWELDAATGELLLDDGMAQLLGAAGPRLAVDRLLERVHADDRDGLRRCLARAVDGGEQCEVTYRLAGVHGDLRRHVGWLRVAPIDGAAARVQGCVVDVTDATRAEAALRTSEEERLAALRAWGVGTWTWDLATGALQGSSTMDPLRGLAPGEFGGTIRAFLRAVHPEDRAMVQERLRGAARDGHDFDEEFRSVWPDGSLHWIAAKGRVYRDADGRPARVLGLGMEVTRQVRHRLRQDALLRLARLLAAEPDATSVLQALLRAVLPVFGADSGAVYRQDAARGVLEPVAVAPVNRPLLDEAPGSAVAASVAAGRPVTARDEPDGAARRTVIAVPLLHGRVLLGALEIGSSAPNPAFDADDTALLEVGAGLAAAALAGVEQTRLQAVLLTGRTAQHEINNALALTLGYADLLAGDPRLPDDLREMARLALQGAEEVADRVRRLASITTVTEVHTPGLDPVMDLSPAGDAGPAPPGGAGPHPSAS